MDEQQGSWYVTGQLQGYGIGPDGRATDGYTVYFTTARGNTGNVFVPARLYNPEAVKQMVTQAASAMDSIAQLTGTH